MTLHRLGMATHQLLSHTIHIDDYSMLSHCKAQLWRVRKSSETSPRKHLLHTTPFPSLQLQQVLIKHCSMSIQFDLCYGGPVILVSIRSQMLFCTDCCPLGER